MKSHKFHNLLGEDKNQLLILVDKSGKKIGSGTREECHKGEGKTHLAFLAFIFDKEGKVILAKRSSKKSLWGGFWDATVVSHILPGETPEKAANRRGKEEMGVNVKFTKIEAFYYFARQGRESENEYCYSLVGKAEKEVNPNPIEISEIKKIDIDNLIKGIESNPNDFTPWLKIALNKFKL